MAEIFEWRKHPGTDTLSISIRCWESNLFKCVRRSYIFGMHISNERKREMLYTYAYHLPLFLVNINKIYSNNKNVNNITR